VYVLCRRNKNESVYVLCRRNKGLGVNWMRNLRPHLSKGVRAEQVHKCAIIHPWRCAWANAVPLTALPLSSIDLPIRIRINLKTFAAQPLKRAVHRHYRVITRVPCGRFEPAVRWLLRPEKAKGNRISADALGNRSLCGNDPFCPLCSLLLRSGVMGVGTCLEEYDCV
jgi:hypothetical protein